MAPLNPFKYKLLDQKNNKLSFLQASDIKTLPMNSPALKDLQSGPSRVKKLSKLFEEKSKTYSNQTNWWLDERKSGSPGSPKPRINIHGVNDRIINSPGKLMTKLERIVSELVQKELTYIQTLERGIDYYLNTVKEGGEEVPSELRHQTFKLFGNIEDIFKLHKESVYPRLVVCNGNAKLIAETITSFVQNDFFYCYITYSINQKFADQLISIHQGFFESLRSTSDDLLGINSFIIQPIQKLPRYKMLFDEMIKELSSDVVLNKETIAACCVAEKSIQRLLKRLNGAMSINDIVETNEFMISVQMSLLTTMQNNFGVNVSEPMMLLVPKTSSSFPFRSPVSKVLRTLLLKPLWKLLKVRA